MNKAETISLNRVLLSSGQRWCPRCTQATPIFKGSYCRECVRTDSYNRWASRTHGVSLDSAEDLLVQQGGICAICKIELPQIGQRAAMGRVDHDHATGRIRGVLCSHCNRGLGYFRDNPELLVAAAKYLSE